MNKPNPKSTSWKSLEELKDPFNDAVNYRTRQEKEFFNQIFLRTSDLFDCLKPSVYYLIGEKGSGKTAYAAYLENNDVEKTRCKLSTMTESQYKRFIALKRQKKLEYSDYANIWRPMLLNMTAQALVQKSKGFLESFTGKFDEIENEVESFNRDALNPEVEVAFEMISESTDTVQIGHEKVGKLAVEDKSKKTDKTEQIKHHLLEKETRLKQAIADLRLSRNHVLFIDGIDYRPEDVPYHDYLACVKGLGEAVWQLNTEYFGNIRDSKGRIKVVLLVRPDVFHSLNLYNSNSRLRDNSVLLDWSTTELGMRDSRLYEATGKFFASQQDQEISALVAADHYLVAEESQTIFRRLLRASFQKPRDLLTFIKIARAVSVKRLGRGSEVHFGSDIVRNPDFTKEYADYLLGEVRNYAAFYMEQNDFFLYIKFFQYLDGKREFKFDDFARAFDRFKDWIRGETVKATEYLRDPEALLQFFFDINVVGYREIVGDDAEKFFHFSFRERTLTNIAPKVKTSGILVINLGVSKALDIGLRVQGTNSQSQGPSNPRQRREVAEGMRGSQASNRHMGPRSHPAAKAPTSAPAKKVSSKRPRRGSPMK